MLAVGLAITVLGSVLAEDRRTEAIDAYLLIDRSAAMATSGPAAAQWLCDQVVDGLLQSGDRVTLWAFSEKSEKITEMTLSTPDSKEALKKAIRSVGGDSGTANFSGVLHAVAAMEAARIDRNPIAYVLLASPLVRESAASGGNDAEAAALLRFSRIEDHPGWKAVTLGLGLEHRARTAATLFIEGLKRTTPE